MSNRHSGMSEEQRAHILANEKKALERVFRRLANFDKKKDFLKQVSSLKILIIPLHDHFHGENRCPRFSSDIVCSD